MPSRIYRVYWAYTLNDIKFKIRTSYGERQAKVNQDFETFCVTISTAFGGEDEEKAKAKKMYQPQTVEEVERAFNSIFG